MKTDARMIEPNYCLRCSNYLTSCTCAEAEMQDPVYLFPPGDSLEQLFIDLEPKLGPRPEQQRSPSIFARVKRTLSPVNVEDPKPNTCFACNVCPLHCNCDCPDHIFDPSPSPCKICIRVTMATFYQKFPQKFKPTSR